MSAFSFRCLECGARYGEDPARLVCSICCEQQQVGGPTRGILEVELDALPSAWPAASIASREVLPSFLPVRAEHLPDLAVGGTPLLPVARLRCALGMDHLWVKDDTRNPSGSTKDRASQLVVAKALEYGCQTVAAASSGNAGVALAALAAATGVRAVVFVPASVPEAKLVQMLSYGATVLPVDGTYDDAFDLCLAACDRFGWYNRNTALNPFTIEGKKTAALEIGAALAPEVPDAVVVPVGDGVILAGIAKGFADLMRAGLIARVPRLIAVQAAGSAAIVRALDAGQATVTPLASAETVADSLSVKAPRGAYACLRAIRESGGSGVTVSDDAILDAIPFLAGHAGVFAEPAAAASLAGLVTALDRGLVGRDERVVLLITGTGLKDVAAASRVVQRPLPISPNLEDVGQRTEEEGRG